jgi:hypothetical protein
MMERTREEWLESVREHFAKASVGSSTLRSQVNAGGVEAARNFLKKKILLTNLENISEKDFSQFLNTKTKSLSKILTRPDNNQPNFGAARKVINIFLRLCAMNKDLHRDFKLVKVERFLEVPLDSYVVKGIDANYGSSFARGFTIKNLKPKANTEIQNAAKEIAFKMNLHRYELDVLFWGNDN